MNNLQNYNESKFNLLTKRELEVFNQLCEGYSNAEIANVLFISVVTVKVHLKHIYRKLGVKNRAQAIVYSKGIDNNSIKNKKASTKGKEVPL